MESASIDPSTVPEHALHRFSTGFDAKASRPLVSVESGDVLLLPLDARPWGLSWCLVA